MSSSSSCAEDHSQVEYLPEKKALRVDFKVGSADDWPNFKLEDGEVFYKDGKTFANLLHTDIEGPFIVRGKLIVANDEVKERKCLLRKKFAECYIESTCVAYSVGELPTTVWAAGDAGWFEFSPSSAYKPIYEGIMKGIELYYGLIQVYEDASQSGDKYWRTKSADEVFIQYGLNNGTGLCRSEILARVRENGQFLLCQLHREAHGSFATTPLFKWLKEEFKDIYTMLMKTSKANPLPSVDMLPISNKKKTQPERLPVENDGVANDSKNDAQLRGIAPSKKELISPNISARKSSTQSPVLQTSNLATIEQPARTTAEIVEVMLECMDHLLAEGKDRKRITLATLGTYFYKKFKFPQHYSAPEIVRLHARALLARLPPGWKGSALERTCREETVITHSQLSEASKKVLQGGVIRRDKSTTKRTSPSTYGKKEAGARTRKFGSSVADSPASPSPQLNPLGRSHGHYAGKAASLRIPGSSLRRPSESPDVDEYYKNQEEDDFAVYNPDMLHDPQPPRKRRRPGQSYNQDNLPMYYPNGEDSAVDGFTQFELVTEDLPDDYHFTANDFAPGINKATPLSNLQSPYPDAFQHTYPPNDLYPQPASLPGPQQIPFTSSFSDTVIRTATGLWICPVEDCVVMLRDIETEAGRRMFLAHRDFHTTEEVVLEEGVKAGLSVSHLMERLRRVGDGSGALTGAGEEVGGEVLGGKKVKERIARRGEEM